MKRSILVALGLMLAVLQMAKAKAFAAPIELLRNGSSAVAFPTIQQALDAAQPGDIVQVSEGLYFEPLRINTKSGRADAPITFRARPGDDPVISLADPVFTQPNGLWVPRPDLAPGVYATTARPNATTHGCLQDGTPLLFPRGILRGSLRADFIALAGADVSVILQEPEGGVLTTFVYLEGGRDPRVTPLFLPRDNTNTFSIRNSEHIVVEGITFRDGASQTIDIQGSRNILLDGLTVFGGKAGIRVKESTPMPEDVTIRRCRVTKGLDPRWFNQDLKQTQLESVGISVRGRRHVVEYCDISLRFDGFGASGEFLNPDDNVDIIFRRNYVHDVIDDSLEFDGYFTRGEVYENLVLGGFKALSFAPRLARGPEDSALFYRNVIEANQMVRWMRDPDNPRVGDTRRPAVTKFGQAADTTSPHDFRFFHNTLLGSNQVIDGNFQRVILDKYMVNTQWVNNIVISAVGPVLRRTGTAADGNFYDGNLYFQEDASVPMFVDFNVDPNGTQNIPTNSFTSLADALASPAGQASGWERSGLQADPLFDIFTTPTLTPLSPAIDSAVVLPTGFVDSVMIRGSAGDRGAFEFSNDLNVFEVIPSRGRLRGGNFIVIRGSDFDGRVLVDIGGTPVPSSQVTVVSATTLFVAAPAGRAAGPVDVVLRKGGASAALRGGYAYFGPDGSSEDRTPPQVAVTAPAPGTVLSSAVTLTADASDAGGVAGVQFQVDGVNLGAEDTSAPYSVSWDAGAASAGTHVLKAVARDAAGNTAESAGVSVTVFRPSDPGPRVGLPLDIGESFTASAPASADPYAVPGDNGTQGRLMAFLPPSERVAQVHFERLDPSNSALASRGEPEIDLMRGTRALYAYDLSIPGRTAAVFNRPGRLTLPYLDGDQDGVEDDTGVPEALLRVFWWDGFRWRLLGGVVDNQRNEVSVPVSHFSMYALWPLSAAGAAAKAEENFLSPGLVDGINDLAVFGAEAEEVGIFDLQGEKVFEASQAGAGGSVIVWNARDQSGRLVESGVYIARVRKTEGGVAYQKITVVK